MKTGGGDLTEDREAMNEEEGKKNTDEDARRRRKSNSSVEGSEFVQH